MTSKIRILTSTTSHCLGRNGIACYRSLRTILERLQEAGFAINPRKCHWCVQEVPLLGHLLTPEGIKPLLKKVNAILNMSQPTNLKELKSFLGLVTCYRDMWKRRAHILAPLTDLLGPTRFAWDDRCDDAFDTMKATVAKDTLLIYPDHNRPFVIESAPDTGPVDLRPGRDQLSTASTRPAGHTRGYHQDPVEPAHCECAHLVRRWSAAGAPHCGPTGRCGWRVRVRDAQRDLEP